jgi:hypothetical protein
MGTAGFQRGVANPAPPDTGSRSGEHEGKGLLVCGGALPLRLQVSSLAVVHVVGCGLDRRSRSRNRLRLVLAVDPPVWFDAGAAASQRCSSLRPKAAYRGNSTWHRANPFELSVDGTPCALRMRDSAVTASCADAYAELTPDGIHLHYQATLHGQTGVNAASLPSGTIRLPVERSALRVQDDRSSRAFVLVGQSLAISTGGSFSAEAFLGWVKAWHSLLPADLFVFARSEALCAQIRSLAASLGRTRGITECTVRSVWLGSNPRTQTYRRETNRCLAVAGAQAHRSAVHCQQLRHGPSQRARPGICTGRRLRVCDGARSRRAAG